MIRSKLHIVLLFPCVSDQNNGNLTKAPQAKFSKEGECGPLQEGTCLTFRLFLLMGGGGGGGKICVCVVVQNSV